MYLRSFKGKVDWTYLDTSITVKSFHSKHNLITNIYKHFFKRWPLIKDCKSIKSWIGWSQAQQPLNLKIHNAETLASIIELLVQPPVNSRRNAHPRIKNPLTMIYQGHRCSVKEIFLSLLVNQERGTDTERRIKQRRRAINHLFTLITCPPSITNLEVRF